MATGTDDDGSGHQAKLARTLAEGGITDVIVISQDTAAKVLTDKRRELIDRIRESDIDSTRRLAEELDRDVSAVSRDLDVLFESGIIEYDRDGQRKIPVLKHNEVIAPIAHKPTTE